MTSRTAYSDHMAFANGLRAEFVDEKLMALVLPSEQRFESNKPRCDMYTAVR